MWSNVKNWNVGLGKVYVWHGETARHPPFHFSLFIGVFKDFGFTSYISETNRLYTYLYKEFNISENCTLLVFHVLQIFWNALPHWIFVTFKKLHTLFHIYTLSPTFSQTFTNSRWALHTFAILCNFCFFQIIIMYIRLQTFNILSDLVVSVRLHFCGVKFFV